MKTLIIILLVSSVAHATHDVSYGLPKGAKNPVIKETKRIFTEPKFKNGDKVVTNVISPDTQESVFYNNCVGKVFGIKTYEDQRPVYFIKLSSCEGRKVNNEIRSGEEFLRGAK